MKKTSLLISFTFILALFLWIQGGNFHEKKSSSIESEHVVKNDIKKIGNESGKVQERNFKDATELADLIVRVKIGTVLKEIEEPYNKTIFKANVLEVFKNISKSTVSEINIMQQGTSQITFNHNDLFQNGDEYYLFLKEAKGYPIENTYWILGEETTFYKITGKEVKKVHFVDEELKDITTKIVELKDKGKIQQYLNKEKFQEKLKREIERNKEA